MWNRPQHYPNILIFRFMAHNVNLQISRTGKFLDLTQGSCCPEISPCKSVTGVYQLQFILPE